MWSVLDACLCGEEPSCRASTLQGSGLDLYCGSGGMFVQSERFVESHGGCRDDISIYRAGEQRDHLAVDSDESGNLWFRC
ncbi:SAM-dependent DNA methyltransferase [cyanobiont of Ornithocercus magnificus]|nr:SAM-dependent DNA methyltransferase [cyanobiont of Ornithocercus magnificus]